MGLNDTFLHDILPLQSISYCRILPVVPAFHEEKKNGTLGSVYLLRVRIHCLDVPSTISLLPRIKELVYQYDLSSSSRLLIFAAGK